MPFLIGAALFVGPYLLITALDLNIHGLPALALMALSLCGLAIALFAILKGALGSKGKPSRDGS